MTYDALNRQVTTKTPSGALSTVVYDAAGNVVNQVDPLGHTSTFVYDALHRQTVSIDALGVLGSLAIRSATDRAAMRRGWVWPISPPPDCVRRPRPSSRQIFGSWVVLPDPVSPATITTWWSLIAAAMSSRRWVTGSSGG